MANGKTKEQGKKVSRGVRVNVRPRPRLRIRPAVRTAGLDPPAAAYARLLADPCSAALCHSIYPGSSGTFVSRFEADQTITSDSGFFVFSPGTFRQQIALSATGATFNGYTTGAYSALAASDSVGANMLPIDLFTGAANAATANANAVNPSKFPGGNFLISNASEYRALSACLQVMYVGTELNRSGTISTAIVPSDAIGDFSVASNNGTASLGSISTASVRSLCDKVERTPGVIVERKWSPGVNDGDFVAPALGPTKLNSDGTVQVGGSIGQVFIDETEYDKHNAVVVSWAGLSSNPIRIRMVLVAEWMPQLAKGLVQGPPKSVKTKNTLNDVLSFLESKGDWTYTGTIGQMVGRGVTYGLDKAVAAMML